MSTPTEPVRVKIDFVSDVSCPWCAIGLKSLEQAIAKLDGEIQADIHFQPFELNQELGAEGEDSTRYLMLKYNSTAEQIDANREAIRARGEALGFDFRMDHNSRVWNTFDAHRLLHWAGLEGRQLALKHALLKAYFSDGENVSDHTTLARLAGEAGLDSARAQEILDSGTYADEVREQQVFYTSRGVRSVPATVLNDSILIRGGQPPEFFEHALREAAGRK